MVNTENINEINKNNKIFKRFNLTPLTLSYLLNYQEIFENLIKISDINELDFYGYNILFYAILKEDIKMIKYLINNGIDINFKQSRLEGRHHSALDISIYIKNKNIFDILLSSKNILLNMPNKLGEVPLITIIKFCDCNIKYKKEIIEKLLKSGANINFIFKHKYSPLVYAIQEKDITLVKLLIDNRADVNFIDEYGDTPLIYAIKENSLQLVELLIKNNADINYIDKQGYSPLFYAIQNESELLVNLLIKNGANINNEKAHSPIESALLIDSLPMIQLLMENGLNKSFNSKLESNLMLYLKKVLNSKNDDKIDKLKKILFFLANNYSYIITGNIVREIINYDKLNFLKILINYIDINIKDKFGNTPLANAIILKKRKIIHYLINNGANIHSVNNNSKTIYDICYDHSNDTCGKIIFNKIKKYF